MDWGQLTSKLCITFDQRGSADEVSEVEKQSVELEVSLHLLSHSLAEVEVELSC